MKRYQNSKETKTRKREEIKRRANMIYNLMLEKPISASKTISKSQ